MPRAIQNRAWSESSWRAWALALLLGCVGCAAGRDAAILSPADPYRVEGGSLGERARPAADHARDGRLAGRTSALAYPTGDPATSLLLVERFAPLEVRSGEELVFQLRVTNLTELPLEDVVLTEYLDPAFEPGLSDPPPTHEEDGRMRWDLGRLEPGGRRYVEIPGVAVRGPGLDPATSVECRPLLRSRVRVSSPQLRLRLSAPEEVQPCEDLVLRISVTNTGRSSTQPSTVNIDLPTGVATPDGRSHLQLGLGPIAVGELAVRETRLLVREPGAHALRATLATDEGRVSSNVVAPLALDAQLAVAVESEGAAYVGSPLRYRIRPSNGGNGAVHDAVLEFAGPDGCELLAATPGARAEGNVVRWTIGRLHAGAEELFEATFVGAAPGTVRARARLEPPCGAAVQAADERDVLVPPELSLRLERTRDRIADDEQAVLYTLAVANQGSQPLEDLGLTLRPAVGVRIVRLERAGAEHGWGVAEWSEPTPGELLLEPIERLVPGRSAVWRIATRADRPGRYELETRLEGAGLVLPLEQRDELVYP